MRLAKLTVPLLSQLEPEPRLEASVYEGRIAGLRRRMGEAGLDAVLVYGDREHYANVSYLTGFDPRFEEALVLVHGQGDPVILAGNEDLSFCEKAGLAVTAVLCQSLSLPGQDRSLQRRVSDGLAEAGLPRGSRLGVAGWKPIPREDAPSADVALAVPQFVLSEVQEYVDRPIADATLLLCGVDGMRAQNEADQLALHEHRATRASDAVWRAIEALAPGRTELEVSAGMGLVGLPLACHVMCTSGATGVNGLSSPTDRVIESGDWFSTAVGFWGGLCCRAGLVAEATDPGVSEFVERFAAPYYEAVRAWYRTVGIGVRAGDVSRAVADVLEPTAVRTMLDAGHLIHLDEWLDSPFAPGSEHVLRSGTALQADIIPVSRQWPDDRANVEDSLALADEELRAEICERYPEAWGRICARREFMRDALGIEIGLDVLPFSDRQGLFTPALLSADMALVP